MKSKSHYSLLFLLLLVAAGPALAQKKSKKAKGKILGEELSYGRQAAEFGLWNEAIFHWKKVVEKDPTNSEATNNLAVAYESIGNYDMANKLYQQAYDLDEDSAEIRKNKKRFSTFYRKHRRQLAREQKIKAKKRAEAEAREREKAKQERDDTKREGSL